MVGMVVIGIHVILVLGLIAGTAIKQMPKFQDFIDTTLIEAKDEPPLVAFQGKVAALIAASPGALGGLRGLRHVREILSNINVLVIPQQFALVKAHEAFDGSGKLTDAKTESAVKGIGSKLAEVVTRLG